MNNRTLYVRQGDEVVWEQAVLRSRRDGVSLSEFVVTALKDRMNLDTEQACQHCDNEPPTGYQCTWCGMVGL